MRWKDLLLFVTIPLCGCSTHEQPDALEVDLAVLTLNLHTYQELRETGIPESSLTDELARQRLVAYGPIFDRIAAGIDALDPDIICLQEVGEWSGDATRDAERVEFGATDSNMVRQILSRLGDERFHVTMDWSHYGWGVWLEGSAVLSKHPIVYEEARFISRANGGKYESWKSRNVPMAIVETPKAGNIAVFSVHAGWWDDEEEPFQEQFERLRNWADDVSGNTETTILCGDFNIPADSRGYSFMTEDSGYEDQYLLANPDGMFDATIGAGADGWAQTEYSQRIDYILLDDSSPFDVLHARRVFTDEEFGRVSDHVGVYAEFTLANPLP